MGVEWRGCGSLAISLWSKGGAVLNARVMSINCSLVCLSFARTRVLCNVGCLVDVKRGEMKCT